MNTHFDERLIALAHPVRRDILETLSARDCRVTDVAEKFPISLNSVSKHVRMLEKAEIIERRISGRDHFLKLNPFAFEEIKDWIEKNTQTWKRRLEAIDEMLTNEKKSKKAHTQNDKRSSCLK